MIRLPDGLSIGLGLFTGQGTAERPTTIDQLPALAHAAEAAGFDAFWVSEHHGFADAYLPSPFVGLAAAASVTDRILLGTGLALAPLHHAVRLAEDAAVVDVLSGGRLLLGLGIGYAGHEFEMFGVDRRRRGRELDALLPFLRRAWAGERVVPPGGSTPVRVTPAPPDGDIPIWLGGYADSALARAARQADGYLLGRGDRDLVSRTSSRLRDHGADPQITFACNLLTVLDGRRTEPDAALHALLQQLRQYQLVQERDDPYAGLTTTPTAELTLAEATRAVHALGDGDQVVTALRDRLRPLAGWTNVHVVIRALFPTADLDVQVRRISALGRDVLPGLRAWPSGAFADDKNTTGGSRS